MTDIPVCIDISHHQGSNIDFEAVRNAGVLGMIHKCSEGVSYADPMRASNCSAALRAGLAISTYHWLSPDCDPAAQMEFYLGLLSPQNGERVCIDYEEEGCQLSDLKAAINAILAYNDTLRVTLYSGHLLKEQVSGIDDELVSSSDLWLAQYTSGTPSWEGYPNWTLWQYSETGVIPGIDDTYVDLNNFNGDEDAFLDWINPAGAPPPEPPAPITSVVEIAITAPPDVEIRVSVNGSVTRHKARRLIRRGPDLVRRRG
jgi:lysozyme